MRRECREHFPRDCGLAIRLNDFNEYLTSRSHGDIQLLNPKKIDDRVYLFNTKHEIFVRFKIFIL